MRRFVCVHGHFYQPPRENPGLDEVERQDSAAPYHDWNERITRECYGPNGAARILDADGLIARIVNNYARISFNFGPTLLSWLERHQPDVYQLVLAADRESQTRFGGHGSAMAQVYNHAIMPLCNDRDRDTQVLWGKADFEWRFGRGPQGMWLAETAVDTATLESLAAHGIAYTVLAPRQAARVRDAGATEWRDCSTTGVDPRRAYRVHLPSGREIAVFFYDGPMSQAIAFERLLNSGAAFESRLMGGFVDRHDAQLVHVATDGETYGHHHRFGEMALAHALDLLDARDDVELINYSAFLERFPPTCEVEIVEESSWSCAHGVERWRSNCGCRAGGGPGWTQAWRGPLRAALDELRDEVARRFERATEGLLKDPWRARDAYVGVILDRSPVAREAFFAEHEARSLSPEDRVLVLRLMEQQRHAMNMYTSCGWFFDDIAGIEAVQVLCYADRVVQVDEELFGAGLGERLLAALEKAPGNRPQYPDGRRVYERLVRPSRVDLHRVAAHAVTRAVFDEEAAVERVYCYDVERSDVARLRSGRAMLASARLRVRSHFTGHEASFGCVAAHFGDHALNVGVEADPGPDRFRAGVGAVKEPFLRGDVAGVVRALDQHFDDSTLSFRALFRDEQRRIVSELLRDREMEVEEVYRRIYREFRPLASLLSELDVPLPEAFRPAAAFAIHDGLRAELASPDADESAVEELIAESQRHDTELRTEELSHVLKANISSEAEKLSSPTRQVDVLKRLVRLARVCALLPFGVDLWEVQNLCWRLNQNDRGDDAGSEGSRLLADWSRRLGVRGR